MVDMPDHTHPSSSHILNMSQSFDCTKSHAAHIRRQKIVVGAAANASGKVKSPSIILTSQPPVTSEPTFKWMLHRKNFFTPIFYHSNKPMNNKVTVSVGAQEEKRTLTFALKLYPNGVNWDQDMSASLQVEISGPCNPSPSHAPCGNSCTLYMEVMLVELKKLEQQMLAWRRQVCQLREKRGFILDHFIPHDIIKNSNADSFLLLFNINLSYSLGEDWIWVGASKDLGLMVDL